MKARLFSVGLVVLFICAMFLHRLFLPQVVHIHSLQNQMIIHNDRKGTLPYKSISSKLLHV